MKPQILLLIGAFLITSAIIINSQRDQDDIKTTIKKIYKNLQKEQWKKDTTFIPAITFQHQKGLYSSEVKANIIDKRNSWFESKLRKAFHVDDNNMFVTNFILVALLEAESLGQIELDEDSFGLALDAILSFKDKNFDEDVPIFNFWPQTLENSSWVAQPQNLKILVDMFPDLPQWMQNILNKIGWGFFNSVKVYLNIFRIPADNDDTSVNVALKTMLSSIKDKHPTLSKKFDDKQFNYSKFYEKAASIAYRPFLSLEQSESKYKHLDEIDTRTYRYLYKFIDNEYHQQTLNNRTPSLLLASTWLLTEEERKMGLVDMPLFVNNVDISVNANFLFGLSRHLLTLSQEEFQNFFLGDIRQMYGDITRMLCWAIENKVPQTRPDIALTYYPSIMDFYWFVARTVHFLESQTTLPHQDLVNTMNKLGQVNREHGTQYILNQAVCDQDSCHWDEFLGNYNGKIRGEDRIFSTALAINVLLDTWTTTKEQKLYWKDGATQEIKTIIEKATVYIQQNYGKKSQLRNAFFSGSVKTYSTLPYFLPQTVSKFVNNGTDFDIKANLTHETEYLKVAVKGFINSTTYEGQLNETWHGYKPIDFYGFNTQYGFGFPFWSSNSISYAISLLALSKFDSLA